MPLSVMCNESLLVAATELSLLHLLHLVVLAEDGACLLSLEFRNLNLPLKVHVLAGLLHTVVSLLHEGKWLGHVLLMLDE